jgi:hypothetical protein
MDMWFDMTFHYLWTLLSKIGLVDYFAYTEAGSGIRYTADPVFVIAREVYWVKVREWFTASKVAHRVVDNEVDIPVPVKRLLMSGFWVVSFVSATHGCAGHWINCSLIGYSEFW